MLSPSNTPQKKATIGIRYVTDETKIGVEIFTSFKNIIFAIAVAKNANNTMYPKLFISSGFFKFSKLKKPEIKRYMNAGGKIAMKLPNAIATGFTLDNFIFKKWIFVA